MATLLIENGTLVTFGEEPRILERGAVLVKDGVITRVGPAAEVRRLEEDASPYHNLESLDARGAIVMPGFVCTHHHLYAMLLRGMKPRGNRPRSLRDVLASTWWPLDEAIRPEDLYSVAASALLAGVRAGMTGLVDMHESQAAPEGALSELARACEDVGVRAVLALGASDRAGNGLEGVRENRRFLGDLPASGRVRGMVGLHASYTVTDVTLEAAVELAREKNVGLTFHLAEDPHDQSESIRRYALSATERLHRAGALGEKSLAAHALHLSDLEWELLAGSGTAVSLCPQSNMKHAVGLPDTRPLNEWGIPISVGTAGLSGDVRGQLATLHLLQSVLRRDPAVDPVETLSVIDQTGRTFSKLSGVKVGSLDAGARADLVILEYSPPTPLDLESFPHHFFTGLISAPVLMTMVDGRILYEGGRFPTVDESELTARSRETARRIWSRLA